MRFIYFCVFALLLIGCTQPRTSVVTDGQSGSIVVKAVPGSALVYLDGKEVGKARLFDGTSSVMKVSPGTHSVRLSASGYKDYETKVYISDSREIIEVNLEKVE